MKTIRNINDGNQVSVMPMPGECTHYQTAEGPRIPLRWGSAPTLICQLCGFWRDARSYCAPCWHSPPLPTERDDD